MSLIPNVKPRPDLETMIREPQDFLRGGPKPPPTFRERFRDFREMLADRSGEFACYALALAILFGVTIPQALNLFVRFYN